MNSVHEPSPYGDSETLPSKKTQVKNQTGCMSPQLAQPAHQARPGARARVAVSWPAQCRIVAGLPGRIAASGCRVVAPQRRIAGIVPLVPARCAASSVPRTPAHLALRVSQAQRPYRGRVLRASAVSQRASARPCAVSQDTPLLARFPMSRYKTWPCNTIPYQLCSFSHNTRNCIAI